MGVAWASLLRSEPAGAGAAALENFGLYALIYPTSFLVLHGGLLPRALKSLKYEAGEPKPEIVVKEVRRSLVSVLIATALELLLEALKPWADTEGAPSCKQVLRWSFLMYAWGDWHFYWQHRLMHSDRLYRYHKVHHESRNPNVFSGLSFHPIESTVYFSAMLLPLLAPVPYWAFRFLKLGLIGFPLFGHLGYGPDVADWHYAHHKTTNYNFGGSPLWDVIFGTYYGIYRK